MINTLFLTTVAAILSIFFGEQGRQNHPQYLSGLSRALFPTTFLETAVDLMLISSRSKGRKAPRVGKVYNLAEIRMAHRACVDHTASDVETRVCFIYLYDKYHGIHVRASFSELPDPN